MIQRLWQTSRYAWAWSTELYKYDPKALRRLRQQLRWTFASIAREPAVQGWFAFVRSEEMRSFAAINPRLAFRPMAGYMSARWRWERRCKVLRDTYGYFRAQAGALQEAMLSPGGVLIARLPLGRDLTGTVSLGFTEQFRKEGEVTLSFGLEGVPGAICALAFSLELAEGQGWTCYVGAVQGTNSEDAGELTKAATKALHGLRPKQFMVFLVQEVARTLRLRELRGVGNGIQVFRSSASARRSRVITFDYDELWLEAGGELQPDGWFRMPLKARRRSDDEVKPNKRGQYAKRYQMLDELSRQIHTVLTPFLHA